MKKPETMRGRAKAFAQECVLFGRLRGEQWDGLTTLLVTFAEHELAEAKQAKAAVEKVEHPSTTDINAAVSR